ncbi:MAG: UDP-N-acetylmuramoyl-tripeptide--D-alanyl-D-alanine ligase, partial [Clostridia bacterium]|nr:UDP-N-acetylmuramoyl-tripeptide--D-alanyl-D-alanine ligase [Clostridia bacterium]
FSSLIFSFSRSLFYLYRLQSYNYYAVFKLKSFLCNFAILIIYSTAVVTEKYLTVVGDIVFVALNLLTGALFLGYYLSTRKRFRFTNRGIRISAPYFACILALNITFSLIFSGFIRLISLASVAFFSEYMLFILNGIIAPFERKRNYAYAMRNSKVVRDGAFIKIVVTGSFGKTSCKNILLRLLEEKYSVFTPGGNLNTPMGISKYISELPAGFSESEKPVIFLAEAGARRRGDVSDICRLIGVNYGIITGVCDQHLDTFRTTENVKKAKQELAEMVGEKGVMVFNGDNAYTLQMSKEYAGKSIVVGEKNGSVRVRNLRSTIAGTSFELVTESGVMALKTSLLGRHNAINVALAVALAMELGVDEESIKRVVSSLKPTPHRLELIYANNLTILDDGYNANERGVLEGLGVVESYGGRKVVYAQGVVECGLKRRKINVGIGKKVGAVADVVILSGENARYIRKGLKISGYKGKIYHFKNVMHAKSEFKNILKSGDLLYLQNDIP